jgi:dihydrodipicolinate synthase/N-acetylneuraminate lyase
MVARLHGVVPMLVTPFEADGTVDERSLRRLSTQQLEAGAHGLAVLGLAGEGTFLSIEERERVAAVVGEVAGGVPLLVGCTADTTAEAVRLAAGAASLGASMIMVAPPRRPDWGPDELLVHYRTVAEAAGCTVMVQDAPGFIGVGLGVDFVLALAREVANVRAYKVEALPLDRKSVV